MTDYTEYRLSDREVEVWGMVAKGLRNKEIALRLSLAEKTVKNHISNLYKSLRVNSRAGAIALYFQHQEPK